MERFAKIFEVDSMGNVKVELATLVVDPPQWSAEFPNLFILLVQLKNADGKVTEAFHSKNRIPRGGIQG